MMICTFASNPDQERKRKKRKEERNPFCTTVTSTGHEVGWRLACHLCEQSKAKRSSVWSRRNDLHLCKKIEIRIENGEKMNGTSWNLRWTVLGFQLSRRFRLLFFLHKQDGRAAWRKFSNMLQPLCDTNILQYVLSCFFLSVFAFRYWAPVRRPALTHRLITWFLHIYKNL